MAWIFAAVVFLTVVYLLVQFPAVRKATLWIVGALVVVGVGVYYKQQNDERAAKAAINPTQLELADLTLSHEYSWKITGTIRNRSKYVLSSVTAGATLEECKAAKCEVVDEADVTIYERVPPGQARHFENYLSFAASPPDDWRWSFAIKEVQADLN